MIAFGFGLVHGFGFSFALRETLQFAGSHLLTSLVAFNVGVELGQLAFVAVVSAALCAARRVRGARRLTSALPAYAIGAVAAYWVIDRVFRFWA